MNMRENMHRMCPPRDWTLVLRHVTLWIRNEKEGRTEKREIKWIMHQRALVWSMDDREEGPKKPTHLCIQFRFSGTVLINKQYFK